MEKKKVIFQFEADEDLYKRLERKEMLCNGSRSRRRSGKKPRCRTKNEMIEDALRFYLDAWDRNLKEAENYSNQRMTARSNALVY